MLYMSRSNATPVTFRIDSGLGDQGFCIQTPRDDDTRCLWIAVNVHEFACVP